MRIYSSNRTVLTLSLAICFLGLMSGVLADDGGIEKRLAKSEQLLLGKSNSADPMEARLSAIEMSLYGKTKHGSVEKRLDAITDILGVKQDGDQEKVTPKTQAASSVANPVVPEESQVAPRPQSATRPGLASTNAPSAATNDSKSAAAKSEIKAATAKSDVVKSTSQSAGKPPVAKMVESGRLTGQAKAATRPVKNGTASLKAQEPQMAAPPVAPARNSANMPPLAPPIATTMRKKNEINSPSRELLREGLRLHSKGQDQEAENTFRQVLSVDPRNADAFYNLGSLAESRHDLIMALTNYRAALTFNPTDKDYMQAVAQIERELSTTGAANQQTTVGHFTAPEFAAGGAQADGSTVAPFHLSSTQNDVLMNASGGNLGSFPVTQNQSAPSLSVSQKNPPSLAVRNNRGPFGVVMGVGVRYALGASGLHCPICRIMGGGFHF